jgi:hypothetical protein
LTGFCAVIWEFLPSAYTPFRHCCATRWDTWGPQSLLCGILVMFSGKGFRKWLKGWLCRVHAVSAAVVAAGMCMVWPLVSVHSVNGKLCIVSMVKGQGGVGLGDAKVCLGQVFSGQDCAHMPPPTLLHSRCHASCAGLLPLPHHEAARLHRVPLLSVHDCMCEILSYAVLFYAMVWLRGCRTASVS